MSAVAFEKLNWILRKNEFAGFFNQFSFLAFWIDRYVTTQRYSQQTQFLIMSYGDVFTDAVSTLYSQN